MNLEDVEMRRTSVGSLWQLSQSISTMEAKTMLLRATSTRNPSKHYVSYLCSGEVQDAG